MVVRGAPAIGVAAAYGIALAAAQARISTRPTASCARRARRPSTSPGRSTRCATTRRRARAAHSRATRSSGAGAMAAHAAELLAPGTRALTHCNAGGLATGGYGSAVGALLTAWERGLLAHVWVDETRPLLQGARLTAWELETAAIPHAVIADSAAASLHGRGRGRLRDHRRRPDRRERRHREQDRHVLARRARAPPRRSRSTSSRRARPSTSARRTARRSRSRNATRRRSRRASRRGTRPSTSRRRR